MKFLNVFLKKKAVDEVICNNVMHSSDAVISMALIHALFSNIGSINYFG